MEKRATVVDMDRRPVAQRPKQLLGSVDNTLRLLQMLRDTGALKLTDAAEELGISPSTAHRLLSMLVYRGFSVQDESRIYHPGPGIVANATADSAYRRLLAIVRRHLATLTARTGETSNVMVRVGTTTRFLASEEGKDLDRVSSRAGEILPARHTSGGQALLAELDDTILVQLYRSRSSQASGEYLDSEQFLRFRKRLDLVRLTGSALNLERTERGVAARGMAVHGPNGEAAAAISVAVPSARSDSLSSPAVLRELTRAVGACEAELSGDGSG